MKNLTMCLCLFFIMSCKTDNSQTNNLMASLDINTSKSLCSTHSFEGPTPIIHPHPYELQLNLHDLDKDAYNLEIAMKLNDDSHFVSPNSKGDFKGIFTVFIENNDKIERTAKLLETPLSVEEYDSHPFVNGFVNWVRENTTYNQKIKLKSNEDFEVKGHIQFTIEPRCTLEKIPFIIKNKNGELKFEVFGC